MAQTDWYNTNEHIQYPFKPYEVVINPDTHEPELTTDDIVDCQFFLNNSESAKTGSEAVWLSSKNLTDTDVEYTFKCSDTTDKKFKPLVFKFSRSKDWQGKWVHNDDWYGFVAIGRSK